jgi:ferredoxin
MANYENRLAPNVRGPWYTDANCIDCDMCRQTAPMVFKQDQDIGYTVVFHQPEDETERNLAQEAMEGCPVEAIGRDGPLH